MQKNGQQRECTSWVVAKTHTKVGCLEKSVIVGAALSLNSLGSWFPKPILGHFVKPIPSLRLLSDGRKIPAAYPRPLINSENNNDN